MLKNWVLGICFCLNFLYVFLLVFGRWKVEFNILSLEDLFELDMYLKSYFVEIRDWNRFILFDFFMVLKMVNFFFKVYLYWKRKYFILINLFIVRICSIVFERWRGFRIDLKFFSKFLKFLFIVGVSGRVYSI